MLLSDIFEHLTYGELSTLKIGGLKDGGEINSADYPQVISFINLAMVELYKKFLLLEKNVTIQLLPNILEYELTYDHAVSNPAPVDEDLPRYIMDVGYNTPFTEDVLQIHSVYDLNFEEIPINDLNERTSVFTPFDNVLQVPYPDQGDYLDLIYHAYPKKIDLQLSDPTAEQVRIPAQLLSALLAYVGFRAHISLPAGDKSKATEHLSRFTGICNEIRLLGTLNQANLSNLKLKDKGWS